MSDQCHVNLDLKYYVYVSGSPTPTPEITTTTESTPPSTSTVPPTTTTPEVEFQNDVYFCFLITAKWQVLIVEVGTM